MRKKETQTTPAIYIIVLQYNNSEDVIRCVESLSRLDYPDLHVLVVDNASTVEHLNSARFFVENQAKANGRFQLLKNRVNLGYAGGNNTGIRRALKEKADYLLILNPDTIVEENLLTRLIASAEANPDIGIIGPAINEGDRVVYYGDIAWLKPELAHSTTKPTGGLLTLNQYIPGAAMMVRAKVLKDVGLLDEKYFLYFEDADFCFRAAKKGYMLACEPEAVISHAVSTSTGVLGAARLLRYHYRNSHIFNFKNGPFFIKISLPFWSISIIIRQIIKLLMGRNRQISRAILDGVIDFYKGSSGKIT